MDDEDEIEEEKSPISIHEEQPQFITQEPLESSSYKNIDKLLISEGQHFEPPINRHELSASPESQGGPKKLSLYDLFVIEITTKHLLRINACVKELK